MRHLFLRSGAWLVIALPLFFLSACDTPPTSSTAPPDDATAEVRAVFERTAQHALPQIHFVLSADDQSDWYQVQADNGQLTVTANAPTALSYGTYQYLRSIGAMAVSWEGSRVAIPEHFADFNGQKVTSLFTQRAYLNVCAYGYTMPWWDWQRMGNIEGHEGPLPLAWINKKHQLQKQILARMKALGMQPVVPAFGGYVPKKFTELFPDAKISPMPKWTGFAQETYWLDPADPLFAKVAKRFIELYNQEYGQQQYYLSDSFNEMLPPVSTERRYADLAQYGENIYQSIQQAAPGATWVMQGWMFGADEEFWDLPSIEAFLSKVPNDKVMIHDIGNDRYHVWQRARGFFNKTWTYGFIHNYGGSNPVYGDFDYYHQQVNDLLSSPSVGNVTGFGVFPEGINNNSIVYDYLFDLPWNNQGADRDSWLKPYLTARYGQLSETQLAAWSTISDAVFTTQYWTPRWWNGSAGAYVLFKRPTQALREFADHPNDLAKLDAGIQQLLDSSDSLKDSNLFVYDLVDFVKQSVSLHIDALLQQSIAAYQQGNAAAGDALLVRIDNLSKQLDGLLGLHDETLTSWVNDAKAYGDTEQLADYYALNAKQQITVWGGSSLKDYASKAWQGMYADYYLPRWKLYLNILKTAGRALTDSEEQAAQQQLIDFEHQWIASYVTKPTERPVKPLAQAKALMDSVLNTQKDLVLSN